MTSTITARITTLTGDPDAIRASGRRWRIAAMACAAAAAQVSAVTVVEGFLGDESILWEHRLGPDTSELLSTFATARDIIGGALVSYAEVLDDCQQELRSLAVHRTEAGIALDRWRDTTAAAPDLIDSATQTVHDLDARRAAVLARHTAAVRACGVQIDRATAMSPSHVAAVRAGVAARGSVGGGPGRFRQSSNAVMAGFALTHPAQLSAVGPFLATDDPRDIDSKSHWIDPATRERYFQDLYRYCLGKNAIDVDDLTGSGAGLDVGCRGYADSALSSPDTLVQAVTLSKGAIAMPPLPMTTFGDVWSDYIDALHDMGTMADQAGDTFLRIMIGGCMEGGSVGACLFDIATAPIPFAKGAKVVKVAVEVVDDGADVIKAGDKATEASKEARAVEEARRPDSAGPPKSEEPPDVVGETGQKSSAITHGPAPENAWATYETIRTTGKAPKGHYPPKPYANDGRRDLPRLPSTTPGGQKITYTEYDVNAFTTKRERGLERLLIGSDGSAYYTSQHYANFTVMIGSK